MADDDTSRLRAQIYFPVSQVPNKDVASATGVGLVVRSASVSRFDLWMLLLTVGTFAGAYPLMYFAQEYISLGPAVLIRLGTERASARQMRGAHPASQRVGRVSPTNSQCRKRVAS